MKLSIMVASIPSRINTFLPKMVNTLNKQIEAIQADAEILVFLDNKKRTVGEKRSDLLGLARGEYVTFIDDDDRITDDYIKSVMDAINANPGVDCIVYNVICTINGGPPIYCTYGIEYEYSKTTTDGKWFGKPAHTMIYKSEIAKRHKYIASNFGEDTDWVKRACAEVKTQARINKVLYYYDFSNATSETRGKL